MNCRTQIQFFPLGNTVVSTIHRIDSTGEETAEVLAVNPVLELQILDDIRPKKRQKGEFIPYM